MKRFSLIALFAANLALFAQGDTGAITGRVIGMDGRPAAGVRVALASPDANGKITSDILTGLTVTDETGRYRIDDIPPGRYGVVAGAVAAPTFYPGTTSISGASVVSVERGITMSGLDFSLATTSIPQPGSQNVLTPAGPPQIVTGKVVVDGPVISTFLPNLKVTFLGTVGPSTTTALPGGSTSISASAFYIYSTDVKLDGNFRLELKAMAYRITVARADGKRLEGFKVKSITLGKIDLLREELRADKPLTGEIIITLQSVPLSNPIKL